MNLQLIGPITGRQFLQSGISTKTLYLYNILFLLLSDENANNQKHDIAIIIPEKYIYAYVSLLFPQNTHLFLIGQKEMIENFV